MQDIDFIQGYKQKHLFISDKGVKSVVYLMDCMEGLKQIPDKYFELAIVDPPYRDIKENQPTKDMRDNGTMDKFGNKPTAEYFDLLNQKAKEAIIWGANNFQLPPFKGFVVWKKKTIGEAFTMSMCEIASLSDGLGTVSKWIEIAPQDKERFHPTQKPIKLYEWLISKYLMGGGYFRHPSRKRFKQNRSS